MIKQQDHLDRRLGTDERPDDGNDRDRQTEGVPVAGARRASS